MIDANELPQYLDEALPELSGICRKAGCKNAYDYARQLIRYTQDKLKTSNTKAACECMKLVEKMYKHGSHAIKNAIENVYVYSFTSAFFLNGDKARVSEIMPNLLLDLYRKQIIYSHL